MGNVDDSDSGSVISRTLKNNGMQFLGVHSSK